MNTLRILITATPLSYSASMIQDNITALVSTVDELESSLEMRYLYFFPHATVLTLIVPYLFYLRNMWGPRILFLWYSLRYLYCFGLKVSFKWILFISNLYADSPFPFQWLMPVLKNNCVMMTATASETSSLSYWQKKCGHLDEKYLHIPLGYL